MCILCLPDHVYIFVSARTHLWEHVLLLSCFALVSEFLFQVELGEIRAEGQMECSFQKTR